MADNKRDFLNIITSPLALNGIMRLYKEHNVVYERVDLYRDFGLSLNKIVQSTYLGDDVMDPVARKQHFDWCWNRVCDDFIGENIFLHENQDLYKYFKFFLNKTFYNIPDKEESKVPNKIEDVWNYLFDYNHPKPIEDIGTFIDIYLMFENSFKKH